jgi:hypothetical protein
MCKNEEEQEEIIKPSLFVYTLEYIRPCAGGERAIAVYSRNKNVVCEQWYEYTTHTHIHDSKCKREKERRRNKLGVDEKKKRARCTIDYRKKRKGNRGEAYHFETDPYSFNNSIIAFIGFE